MIKKLLFSILLFAFVTSSMGQRKIKIITGQVKDSLSVVKNANIINLKTKQGTFSNENGLFRIFASKGDTISFSSVQHITKKIVINKEIFDSGRLQLQIISNIYSLDEFELKRHNLMGRLGIDSKSVPKEKRDSLLRNAMDFSNVDFSKKDFTIDEIEKVRPHIVNTMAGAMPMVGGGASISMPFKGSERLWALRKDLAYKKSFPYKILSELGDQFFFDELKIPIDNYFHFLEYCNPLGIETLHKEGKILDVIKILRTESVSYKEVIKNE